MNEIHHEPTQPKQASTAEPLEAAKRHEAQPTPSPRIYVASLADYNNGRLHGAWIDAARDPADIHADIDAMLAKSKQPDAEEFAIHDYDEFGRWRVGEFDSVERVSRIARGIAEYGDAFAAWADVHDDSGDDDTNSDAFREAYLGHFDSVTDFAMQEAEAYGYDDSLGILPDALRQYLHFDYSAMARDLLASGDITSVDTPRGGVWIFRTHE